MAIAQLDSSKPLDQLDVHDLCSELELDLQLFGLFIEIPVGFNLEVEFPVIPNPGDVAGKLIAKANAALAPLSPIFDIIDILLIVKEVFDAVKSLQPPKIGNAIGKLVPKLDKLRKLIPQTSIPRTIRSIISVLIVLVAGIKADLQAILDAQSRIDLSAARGIALGALDLTAALDCAQANLDFQMELVRNNAAPLNRLIGAVNLFCSIAGLPELPSLAIEAGSDAASTLAKLDPLIAKLTKARNAIPG